MLYKCAYRVIEIDHWFSRALLSVHLIRAQMVVQHPFSSHLAESTKAFDPNPYDGIVWKCISKFETKHVWTNPGIEMYLTHTGEWASHNEPTQTKCWIIEWSFLYTRTVFVCDAKIVMCRIHSGLCKQMCTIKYPTRMRFTLNWQYNKGTEKKNHSFENIRIAVSLFSFLLSNRPFMHRV